MIRSYNKIAILGYAQTGKTLVSKQFSRFVLHTDDYIGNENEIWPELARERFVVEGVEVFRLLDKGLDVDLVIKLDAKFEAEPKHRAQRKACDTIWNRFVKSKPDVKIMMMNEDVVTGFLEMEKARVF